jgi:NO-binding membrane sensor protein with MHYT domain
VRSCCFALAAAVLPFLGATGIDERPNVTFSWPMFFVSAALVAMLLSLVLKALHLV